MPSRESYRREIESLHDFFVQWYAATIDKKAFTRLEDALAPNFEMIRPDGERTNRNAVLEWIDDSYGPDSDRQFDIKIRNVECIEQFDDHALVRYEEWQRDPDETSGRISTVLFQHDQAAPNGVVWRSLQETYIDDERQH